MTHIYATFADPKMAEMAAGALLDHGVREEHLSIIFPEGYKRAVVTDDDHNVVEYVEQDDPDNTAKHGITTTTPADAGAGAAKGAGVGAGIGTAAALAALFVPGFGLVLGGGALALAITGAIGAAAAGAIAGGATGYLKDQGVPADAVDVYHRTISSGGALLTVSPTTEDIDHTQIESLILKYEGVMSRHTMQHPTAAINSDSRTVR